MNLLKVTDLKNKLTMPRVLVLAGFVLAFIGFLLPTTIITVNYVDAKKSEYENLARANSMEAAKFRNQADEEVENGKLRAVYEKDEIKATKRAKAYAAKGEKLSKVIDKANAKFETKAAAAQEMANKVRAEAEAEADKIMAAAYAEVDKYMKPGVDKVRAMGFDVDEDYIVTQPEGYDHAKWAEATQIMEEYTPEKFEIEGKAQDEADKILEAAENKAVRLESAKVTANVVTAGCILNQEGFAYLATMLWAVFISIIAGIVYFFFGKNIVSLFVCWICACGCGIASMATLSTEFACSPFGYMGFGSYVILVALAFTMYALVKTVKTKKAE